MKVYIVGAGPGDEKYLTAEARASIVGADFVITTPRLFKHLAHLNTNMVCKKISEFSPTVLASQNSYKTIVVLVSGDSGFFSASKKLMESLEAHSVESQNIKSHILENYHVECLCGISSLQYLCAKLGLHYDGIKIMSVHGRSGSVIPAVCYNPVVFALTGGEEKAHKIIEGLINAGLENVSVTVGENLSAPDEKIVSGTAQSLQKELFGELASVIIRNKNFANKYDHIPDADFIRSKVPMTKQAVRTLAIAALNIQPADIVLDIGAGTGSVSIEMARKAYEGTGYAIEENPDALELIRQNRVKFGAFNVEVIEGNAPEVFETLGIFDASDKLPPKIKVFIGGSGGKLSAIVASLTCKSPFVDFVITAITLETLHEAVSILTEQGYVPKVSCINAAVAQKVGKHHLMKAENPIYIISGKKSAS